jgi:hypothetical protein
VGMLLAVRVLTTHPTQNVWIAVLDLLSSQSVGFRSQGKSEDSPLMTGQIDLNSIAEDNKRHSRQHEREQRRWCDKGD